MSDEPNNTKRKARACHLHCHSEYSSLDGGSVIKDMPAKLDELGMDALALTDHGVMQGLPEFYETLKAAGKKPILGMEAYVCADRHNKQDKRTYHLTLLAETTEGYHNLCKLSTYAFMEGTIITFGRPRARADRELLARYSKGVIALTGCMASPTMRRILAGDLTGARREVEWLIATYGKDNVYGELQNVGITTSIPADSEIAQLLGRDPLTDEQIQQDPETYAECEAGEVALSQIDMCRILVDHICKPLGIKYVATGDVHYLNEDDAIPHDAMICIGTGQIQKGKRRFSLLPKRYHMRSEQELREALPDWPEAIDRTLEVAERCNAEIEFGRELLPRYPIPSGFSSSREYLAWLCEQGVRYRYGDNPSEEVRQRLAMELDVIDSMGFNDYFLIVWDLFNEAARRGIPSGPGRGSAAGSIVAYVLGITDICPLEYDLLFERFLNPGRKSMPDIDMDFAPSGRDELIEYARRKYNGLAGCETAVAQIITFGRYKSKGALRDAARVLAEPTEEGRAEALKAGDRLSRMVPSKPPNIKLHKALEESEELQKAHKAGGFTTETIDLALWLEDKIRTNGIHAAAVIIADHPLEEDLPLQQFGADHPLHVQYDMVYSEKIGLLKMDFLGLRNLDVINDCIDRIKHVHGVDLKEVTKIAERGVDMYYTRYKIPLDDPDTYKLFAEGRTVGTFQFESAGMREALQLVRPTEFRDLIALVALYRPGSMDYIPEYAARKHGRKFEYLHPALEEIQGETYGITIYQEQSMMIARKLAGFSQSRADDLRKAIGKKKLDLMESMKPEFFEGFRKNGIDRSIAEALWADNIKAADYSFNKSHAACYAYISYITGYLKAHYPNEYMASLLSSVMDDKDKPRLYLTEAKQMGLRVLPPDINRSLRDFAVMEDEDNPGRHDILFGLTALKGVGDKVVGEIREERKRNGPFTSVFDLIRRMPNLNKKVVQALVKGGALDSTGASRKAMHDIVEETIAAERKKLKEQEKEFVKAITKQVMAAPAEGQISLMDEPAAAGTKQKLSSWEKKAVEAAAKVSWESKRPLEGRELEDAVYAGLEKEALRLARKSIKDQMKANPASSVADAVAGIADEEQTAGKSEKQIIDEAAQKLVTQRRANIRDQAREWAQRIAPALAAEWEERNAASDVELALAAETDPPLSQEEWPELDKLNHERSVLNIYVSGHPLDADKDVWERYVGPYRLGEIGERFEGQTVRVVGAIVDCDARKTRAGDTWYRLTLEDLTGAREVTVFPSAAEGCEDLLAEGSVVCIEAKVQEDTFRQAQQDSDDAGEESPASADGASEQPVERHMKLIATKIYRWAPEKVRERIAKTAPVNIHVTQAQFNREWVDQLKGLCHKYPGRNPIRLLFDGKAYRTELRCSPTEEFRREVQALMLASAPS
jgi:DNA polymerase-3 subunit alpha